MSQITPQQAAELLLKRRRAREHFLDFAKMMMPEDQQPQAHHVLMANDLESLARGEHFKEIMVLPPGSAKSTYGSFLFPTYFLGHYPRATIIFASHTAGFAERFGRRCRNTINDAVYQSVFPDTRVASDSAAAGQWSTTAGGEYTAIGAGGRVQGRRADLLIIDDPIGSREDADSQLIREQLWQWYKFDLFPRLKPGARVLVIQTRYHMEDLAGRLLDDEPDKWRLLHLPMEAEPGLPNPLSLPIGSHLWPEWFTDEMVAEAKKDPRTWSSLYQGRPVPIGGGEFKKSWVQFYDDANFSDMPKIILVDPSGGKKNERSDYTSIWVLALGLDENIYVAQMIRDRLDLQERTDVLFKLHRKWKPLQVRYEQYGMQSDIEHIRSQQNARNYRFVIQEVGGTRISKEDRIRRLVPYFRNGRIYFPREHLYTDYSGQTKDLVQVFIEEELAVFPVAAHDDMLDGLSRMAEPSMPLPWPNTSLEFQAPVLSFGVLDESCGY